MSTLIRPEISKKKKEWISKHRYYELKYFSLQYPEWKRKIIDISYIKSSSCVGINLEKQIEFSDPTFDLVFMVESYRRKIEMVERACVLSSEKLSNYILLAVTEGVTYEYLRAIKHMPVSRNTFYKAYRSYFWNLDKLV